MDNNKQLIVDCITFDAVKSVLSESLNNPNKPFVVKGVIQRAEIKNQNGRVYHKNTLLRESQKYIENFIKQRRALGELDHPQSETVNLKNVSHNITDLHWEGNDLWGSFEILSTPSGNILRELFKSNIRLGVSSRAMGSVKNVSENTIEVQDDLELICWDFVSNPSVQGAFVYPESSLNEGKTGVKSSIIVNRWDSVDGIIRDILIELG